MAAQLRRNVIFNVFMFQANQLQLAREGGAGEPAVTTGGKAENVTENENETEDGSDSEVESENETAAEDEGDEDEGVGEGGNDGLAGSAQEQQPSLVAQRVGDGGGDGAGGDEAGLGAGAVFGAESNGGGSENISVDKLTKADSGAL